MKLAMYVVKKTSIASSLVALLVLTGCSGTSFQEEILPPTPGEDQQSGKNTGQEEPTAQRGPGYVTSSSQANTAIAAIIAKAEEGDDFGSRINIQAACESAGSQSCRQDSQRFESLVGLYGSPASFDVSQASLRVPGGNGMTGDFSGRGFSDANIHVGHIYGAWGDWHYFATFSNGFVEGDHFVRYAQAHVHGIPPVGNPPFRTATYRGFTSARRIEVARTEDPGRLAIGATGFAQGDAMITATYEDDLDSSMTLDIALRNFEGTIPELATGVRWRGLEVQELQSHGMFGNVFEIGGWNVEGRFYGPDWQEVAGTYFKFDADPFTAGHGERGVRIVGSFGAKRE